MSTPDDPRAADSADPGSGESGSDHPASRSVTQRVASALGEAAEHVGSAASAVGAAASAVGSAASAVGAVVEATARRFDERPGARVRRIRRLGRIDLPYLYDVHPDARQRSPRALGVRTIDVADIAGTAAAPAGQRGSDFLPLKPFRSDNWLGRWQRLGQAADKLAPLPPIDVLRYDDSYWVVDGHNRVAMALYRGQADIDADVTDLVGAGQPPSDPPEPFASFADDSRELRAVVNRPLSEPPAGAPPAADPEHPSTAEPDAPR
jgi:hypothetical protein